MSAGDLTFGGTPCSFCGRIPGSPLPGCAHCAGSGVRLPVAEGTAGLPADTTTVDAGELRRFAALRDKVAIALHDAECGDRHCEPQAMGAYYRQADIALAAAGPVIAAEAARQERQRNAELAIKHNAQCHHADGIGGDFADVLGETHD